MLTSLANKRIKNADNFLLLFFWVAKYCLGKRVSSADKVFCFDFPPYFPFNAKLFYYYFFICVKWLVHRSICERFILRVWLRFDCEKHNHLYFLADSLRILKCWLIKPQNYPLIVLFSLQLIQYIVLIF